MSNVGGGQYQHVEFGQFGVRRHGRQSPLQLQEGRSQGLHAAPLPRCVRGSRSSPAARRGARQGSGPLELPAATVRARARTGAGRGAVVHHHAGTTAAVHSERLTSDHSPALTHLVDEI